MKKQVLKIAAVDIGAIVMYCFLSKYGVGILSTLETVADYSGIGTMLANVIVALIIPTGYVMISKIVGNENDYLILWNMPLMALIAGVVSLISFLVPSFGAMLPHYTLLMTFAAAFCLSHGIIRLSCGK